MNCDQVRRSLDAYVDDELDLPRRLQMNEHVQRCGTCQKEVKEMSKFKTLVRSNMPAYEAPPELRSKICATLRKESKPRHKWIFTSGRELAYAAVFVASGCVISLTWLSLAPRKENQLVIDAISNHARSLMVSHLIDCASSDPHTVRPWFNGKLDYSPPVPDLAQAGYPLRGGRIDMLDHRPVAAIVYEHGNHIINLFVWPAGERKLEIELQSQRGYHFYAWNISEFNFFCISDVNGPDLEAFEDEVRDHLNL